MGPCEPVTQPDLITVLSCRAGLQWRRQLAKTVREDISRQQLAKTVKWDLWRRGDRPSIRPQPPGTMRWNM